MNSPRYSRAACALAPLLALATACANGPRRPDVEQVEDVVLPNDSEGIDGSMSGPDGGDGSSGSMPEGGESSVTPIPDADVGGMGGPDGGDARADAPPLPVGECTAVADAVEVFREGNGASRELYVAPLGTGYAVGGSWLRLGIPNTQVAFVSTAGMLTPSVQVSNVPSGLVTGGALAADGADGLVFAMASNFEGGLDVYAQRATATGMRRGDPRRVAMDDELSQVPKIVRVGASYLVVWKSTNERTRQVQLYSSLLNDTLTPGPVRTVSASGSVPGNFDLVADGDRAALVYVAMTGLGGVLRGAVFDASGMRQGEEFSIGAGMSASDTVSAAMRGTTIAVFWTESIRGVWLHGVRVDATTRSAGSMVDYPEAGMVSSAGASLDREGFAVAYRASNMMSGAIAMLRVSEAMTQRGRPSFITRALGGAQVRMSSRGDGNFALGWVDSEESMAVGRSVVVRCP